MKVKVLAYCLLLLHLGFVVLPEVQIWQYLYAISTCHPNNELAFKNDGGGVSTGDITYLSALIKRSGNDADNTNQPIQIPETVISHTGLVYLPGELLVFFTAFHDAVQNYGHYSTHLIFNSKRIHTPPPKVTLS